MKKSSNPGNQPRDISHNPQAVYGETWNLWNAFSMKLSDITESAPLVGQLKGHKKDVEDYPSGRYTKTGKARIPPRTWGGRRDAMKRKPDAEHEGTGWFEWFGGFTDPKGSPISGRGGKKSTINDISGFVGTPAERIFDSLPNWNADKTVRGIPSKEDVCNACGNPYESQFWSSDHWELNICSKCSPSQRNKWKKTDYGIKAPLYAKDEKDIEHYED